MYPRFRPHFTHRLTTWLLNFGARLARKTIDFLATKLCLTVVSNYHRSAIEKWSHRESGDRFLPTHTLKDAFRLIFPNERSVRHVSAFASNRVYANIATPVTIANGIGKVNHTSFTLSAFQAITRLERYLGESSDIFKIRF